MHIGLQMKRIIPVFVFLFTFYCSDAQSLGFYPGTDYYGTLEMELYTEHYMYVSHDGTADSTYITWRLIENSCPEEWDFQLCDFQHCYSGMPNTGDMSGLAPGQEGNIRLIVNPFGLAGSGTVHFWIFPTGQMEQYTDVYFHLNTIIADIHEKKSDEFISVDSHDLIIQTPQLSEITVYGINGDMLFAGLAQPGTSRWPISHLATGNYICLINNSTFKFFKP
jgi:hypothetical protein